MASVIENSIRAAITPVILGVSSFNRKRLGDAEENPFLSGVHKPLPSELTLNDLEVTGEIPAELDGTYARIGPNPFHTDVNGHHWFLGDGMVHGIRLNNGRAEWYHNRYIRSRELEEAGGPQAAPGPRRGLFDNVNTNVLSLAGKTLALVEGSSFPVELDENLDSATYSDFGGGLTGSFTAHPHQCPDTGEYHAICYDGAEDKSIRHVVIDKAGNVLRETPVAVKDGPSIHDCALTRNYVVIFDLPVCISLKTLLAGYRFPYVWKADHQPRVGLLPRDGSGDDVIWHEVDPSYVFHIGNSYEDEDGSVVVDCCAYESMFEGPMPGPYGQNLGLERWRLDAKGGKVQRKTLDPTPQEFPRPDERYFTRPYRYLWSVRVAEDHVPDFFRPLPIIRHDLQTGEKIEHDFGKNAMAGEFVFVPRSEDAPEGDGWVMGYVIDTDENASRLEILDAMSLERVAAVHIPHIIPPGFHGNWLPA